LRQLENDKMVESRPRAGTLVRIPQPEEARGRCIGEKPLRLNLVVCAVCRPPSRNVRNWFG